MKRFPIVILSAALALSMLTACSDGSGSSNNTAAGGSTSVSTSAAGSSAADAELPPLTGGFETPALITPAGQSADGDIIQTLCTRANIAVDLDEDATADDLSGYKTLIFAVGGSSKGLGAAGINSEDELARVQSLITAAQEQGIKIISMHVGGSARRGDLSDEFLADPMRAADAAVVVSSGDTDGVIRGYLAENNTPTAYVEGQVDCIDCLTTLFS